MISHKFEIRQGESLLVAECRQYGLDPEKTSLHALECVKHGLDSTRTSINDLKKAGSSLYRDL